MTYDIQAQEERDFNVASDSEWDRAGAAQIGSEDRSRAWILSDRDVWYANPFYTGPAVRHPEDDYGDDGRHYLDDSPAEAAAPVRPVHRDPLDDCPF